MAVCDLRQINVRPGCCLGDLGLPTDYNYIDRDPSNTSVHDTRGHAMHNLPHSGVTTAAGVCVFHFGVW